MTTLDAHLVLWQRGEPYSGSRLHAGEVGEPLRDTASPRLAEYGKAWQDNEVAVFGLGWMRHGGFPKRSKGADCKSAA